jgi:iron(III) transport system substrate-binding protein
MTATFADQGETGPAALSELKLLKPDPAAVLAQSEDIKAYYARLFRG